MQLLSTWIFLGVMFLTETSESSMPIVENLPMEVMNCNIGNIKIVNITLEEFEDKERCTLLTPSGIEFNFDALNISGVEVILDSDVACAIQLNIDTEDLIGHWTLIYRSIRYLSDKIERRKQFIIRIQEIVNASVNEVTLMEGNDLYVRLEDAITDYDTCKLMRPDGNQMVTYERDTRYTDTCGYIVRNMNTTDSGTWEITYGDKIIYKADIRVTINVAEVSHAQNLVWVRDRPVQAIVGPENAVYCRIENPEGVAVSDAIGRCNITLDRASTVHSGTWKMSVGLLGQVHTEDSLFNVNVVEAEGQSKAKTNVIANKPTVSLSCSISSPYPIKSCIFRDPSGRILMANEGVGESRYTFHGAGFSHQPGLLTHECGLLITNPVNSDLGLWRCALDTEKESYYGFLTVLRPFATGDPEVEAAVISEPILTADKMAVCRLVGDSVTMSCSVQSVIRYCYFRAHNGTVFNVSPNQPHDLAKYVGAGFDAGECGIRFPALAASDSGTWSCHVGFSNASAPEQSSMIGLVIHDPITVSQRMDGSRLLVEAQVHHHRELEYCRFVRIDGLGFVGGSTNMPGNYTSTSTLSTGKCGISIRTPTMLDHHPWTVVARIRGQDVELSRSTSHSIQRHVEEQPEDNDNEHLMNLSTNYYGISSLWIIIMAVSVIIGCVAVCVDRKTKYNWTVDSTDADKSGSKAIPDKIASTAAAVYKKNIYIISNQIKTLEGTLRSKL